MSTATRDVINKINYAMQYPQHLTMGQLTSIEKLIRTERLKVGRRYVRIKKNIDSNSASLDELRSLSRQLQQLSTHIKDLMLHLAPPAPTAIDITGYQLQQILKQAPAVPKTDPYIEKLKEIGWFNMTHKFKFTQRLKRNLIAKIEQELFKQQFPNVPNEEPSLNIPSNRNP